MVIDILVTLIIGVGFFAIIVGVQTLRNKLRDEKIMEESQKFQGTQSDDLPEGDWEKRVLPEDLTVQRIHSNYSSYIVPSMQTIETDYPVSNLDRLIWLCLVVEEDTGQKVTVTPSHYWSNKVPQIGYYDILVDGVRGSSIGPYDYDGAWAFITGVSICAEAHFHKYGVGRDKR